MNILSESNTSVKSKEFYKDENPTSEVSKEFLVKGDELLEYISSHLFDENNTDLSGVDELQIQLKTKTVYGIDTNTTIMESLFILDEEFFIEKESDMIIVSHPNWSLIGQGETLYEAIKNMTELAFEVYKSLADEKPTDLTLDANSLRDFLFKVF